MLGDEGAPAGDPLGSGEEEVSSEDESRGLSTGSAGRTGECVGGGVATTELGASRDSTLVRPGGSEGTSC